MVLGRDDVCDDGKCRWLGCKSTAECDQVVPGTICAVRDTNVEPLCWPVCDDVSDCGNSSPASGSDNYRCDRGACVWQGCNATAECMNNQVCTL